MPDMIQDGLDWLASQLASHASQEVTYKRAAQTVTLQAVLGKTDFRVQDALTGASKLEHSDSDFVFTAAELVFGATTIVPQRLDEVRRTVAGVTKRYEVWAPQGERPFKIDPYGVMIRVHARYAGTV